MTNHIDVGSVLRRTVCDLYSNLVTRPTGAAVRREIETVLLGLDTPSLTVIDFSQVGLLDFSCADEVVGKLLDGVRRQVIVTDAYVLVRGVRDDHLEAIEAVMQRYDMAVIVESEDGEWHVVGPLDDGMRRTLDVVHQCGRAVPSELAEALEQPPAAVTETLDGLLERRLVMRTEGAYVSLQSVL
ncbi:MAG TPA: hypothetical protein VF981_04560 [Gemmatimonadaceae bacterium]